MAFKAQVTLGANITFIICNLKTLDMSRSVIKHSRLKATKALSNKLDRSKANRKMRRLCKEKLNSGSEFLPTLRDVSDPWDFKSDGLAIFFSIKEAIKTPWKWLRK